MEGLVFAKNCQGIKYLDPIEVANEMAFKLKHKEKCDLVICVSHLGWEPITQMGDPMMISHSRNIDIVLGGHSHSYFLKPQVVKDADGKDVPVDQNGKHAIFVGKLVLNME
jgi:5'-nucleotidase